MAALAISSGKSHQRALAELPSRLVAGGFRGDVDMDEAILAAMSTDNSVYRIKPDLVVAPMDADDVSILLRVLEQPEFDAIAVTARGGGTGTNGQSLNTGVVVDFRRHMHRILALDVGERWVEVEPGIVLDELNTAIQSTGLFFAPDTSTANRCTIGGMIGTDASGKGSRIYGKTSDNIIGLEVALEGGRRLDSLLPAPDWTAPLLAAAEAASHAGRASLLDHAPRLSRRFTGYDLERATAGQQFEWWRLFPGAEGTLGLVTRARLRLVPRPGTRRLVVLAYRRFEDALAAGTAILRHDPLAIEVMDTQVGRLAKEAGLTRALPVAVQEFEGQPVAYSFVEFSGHEGVALNAAIARLVGDLGTQPGLVGHHVARDAAEIAQLWSVRSSSVGLLSRSRGARAPVAFVEDSVIPLENLVPFVTEFDQLMARYGLAYGIYGHIDVGCLHVRPALDIGSDTDRALLATVSDAVFQLTRKHGGIFWGEHGKGVRGAYLRQFVGETAYAAFEAIKRAFDPKGRFNPGKLVSPDVPLLRIDSTPFRSVRPPRDDGFRKAFLCNGNAECLSAARTQIMCPSFRATRDIRQSPKGRSEALRAWDEQRQRGVPTADIEAATFDSLDTCLGCNACSSKCPVRVDIPSLKSKFLETYYRGRRRPLADIAAVELEHRFPMIDRMRGVARLALHAALPMAERFLDFADLPRLSPQSTRQLWPTISYRQVAQTQWSEGTVFLVGDAFTSLFDVEAQLDVARGLTALGYRPVFASVPPGAKAAFNLGMRERFVRAATRQAKALSMLASAGHPMVGIDPAFVLMLRQEYAELEMGTPHVLLPQEFLLNEIRAGRSRSCLKAPAGASTILLHCTEASALAGAADRWRAVFDALSIPVAVESPGCCGMAGMFGHMRRHQAVSRTLFENWKPLCSSGTSSWATGFSCRTQIQRLSQQVARHPFGLIADAAD